MYSVCKPIEYLILWLDLRNVLDEHLNFVVGGVASSVASQKVQIPGFQVFLPAFDPILPPNCEPL